MITSKFKSIFAPDAHKETNLIELISQIYQTNSHNWRKIFLKFQIQKLLTKYLQPKYIKFKED